MATGNLEKCIRHSDLAWTQQTNNEKNKNTKYKNKKKQKNKKKTRKKRDLPCSVK